MRLLAIELFDKAIHDKVIRSSRRQTAKRESLDLDEQFKFNDSSYKDADRHNESFLPSMTHKEKSLRFSAALSKIPDKKMSNISIMDFKDLLSASHKVSRFRLNSNNDGLTTGMSMKHDIHPFNSDYKEQVNESGSKGNTKRDSLSRSSEKERPSHHMNKESIFTPNTPIPVEEKRSYCCRLI